MFDQDMGTDEAWDVDLLSGTYSTVLSNPLRGKSVSPLRQFNPAVPSIVLRERFDVVFLCGYASPSNWLAMLAARSSGARIIYQSDTSILDERRKHRRWPHRALRKLFLQQVDTFLPIGDKNRDAYLAFGMDPKRMVWCPYPVDSRRFERAQNDPALCQSLSSLRARYGIPEDAYVVAFSGKLIPRKRPDDLVAALRQLGRSDVHALLIGTGPLETSMSESLRVDDNVHITGFVNQSMIPYHLMLADVAVVPSEWDPHPLVTTEFAVCGIPLVVSDCVGVWGDHDVLRPGENGFVYPCGNASELARCVGTLLDDADLRARMKRRSRELGTAHSAERAAEIIGGVVTRSLAR